MVTLLSAGALVAQQAPTKPAPAPTATQAAPKAQAQAKPAAKPKWSADQIKEAQEGLKRAKAYTGPVNGKLGAATRRAIRAFQKAHQMKETGELSDSLLTALKAVP